MPEVTNMSGVDKQKKKELITGQRTYIIGQPALKYKQYNKVKPSLNMSKRFHFKSPSVSFFSTQKALLL